MKNLGVEGSANGVSWWQEREEIFCEGNGCTICLEFINIMNALWWVTALCMIRMVFDLCLYAIMYTLMKRLNLLLCAQKCTIHALS